jgi:hypothetical protein
MLRSRQRRWKCANEIAVAAKSEGKFSKMMASYAGAGQRRLSMVQLFGVSFSTISKLS